MTVIENKIFISNRNNIKVYSLYNGTLYSNYKLSEY
jgi:hypothetical protein